MNRTDTPQGPETEYVSTAQVADALGVSVTTVKRWVDDGVLPAHRTVGGHRKLILSDVYRLVRQGNLPQADLTRLVPGAPAALPTDPEELYERLLAAARARNDDQIRALIQGAFQNGVTIEVLADRVIAPVMRAVGHEWEVGRIEIMHEHQITQACVSALYELKAFLRPNAEAVRPIAIIGAPEHDHYLLPSLLTKMTLLESGWDAVNLGPHTPMSAFRSAIHELRPRLVCISVTHLNDAEVFLEEYKLFYRDADQAGIAVAIGGRGLTGGLRERMPYTFYGDGLTHLAAFARSLHQRPQIPKRGRPPGRASKQEGDES